MIDDLAEFNRARWNDLVDANVAYSRPMLELTPESARAFLDPTGIMGDVAGKEVLCLASGGGQQSVAFALLGAQVTVFDLADKQLERDRKAAAHYGVTIRTIQGDMRNLDVFAANSFDLVYQAFSINFVPSVAPVFAEVARVCRPSALYRIEWFNPFTQLLTPEQDWNGEGYLLRHTYINGREVTALLGAWTVDDENGGKREMDSPREFVHAFSAVINAMAENHFVILRASEYVGDESDAEPGTWFHYTRIIVPYLTLWARYRPDAFV
jgi:ubiquinone/menaquinone biosynthesis C-methylase UbiE